jgi:uncharacterized integral membrane protein (TIGR00697 family)
MKNKLTTLASLPDQPKYLWFLMLSYSMIISISNWYDARLISLFGFTISPGTLTFPFSFLLSDILTEVYGFKNSRRAIWAALFFNSIFLIFGQIIIHLPTPDFAIDNNSAFNKLLSLNIWIISGSFISYIIAEPINSYIVSKLKLLCDGKYMGIRFIGSTVIASFIDTFLFIIIAFYKILNFENLINMIFIVWLCKCLIEIIGLPLTIKLATWLKNNEKLDIYDKYTNFNLCSLDVNYNINDNRYFKI